MYDTFGEIYDDNEDEFRKVAKRRQYASVSAAEISANVTARSARAAADGYARTKLTSQLVGTFIHAVEVHADRSNPALSTVRLDVDTFKRVEVLKNFAYEALIMSSRLKVAEHRG
jgi:dGTPase